MSDQNGTTPPPAQPTEAKALRFSDLADMTDADAAKLAAMPDEPDITDDPAPKPSVTPKSEPVEDDEDDLEEEEDDDLEDDDSEDEDDSDLDEDDEDAEEGNEERSGDKESEGRETDTSLKEILDKKIKVKVNGKLREYTVAQLRDIASSAVHTTENRRAYEEELGKRRAAVEFANAKITPIWEKVKAKDPLGALFGLFEQAGLNKLETVRTLREQQKYVIGRRLGLTPQQFDEVEKQNAHQNHLYDLAEQNEFLQSEQEARKKSEQQPGRSIETKAQALQARLGIPERDFANKVNFFIENTRKQGISLEGVSEDALISQLESFMQQTVSIDKVRDAIQAVRPRLATNEKFFRRVLSRVNKYPEMTHPEIARLVRKESKKLAQKKDTPTELAKDISGKYLAQSKGQVPQAEPSNGAKKPLRFSDFDEETGFL